MGAGGRGTRERGRELALGVLCHLESYPDDERAGAWRLVLDAPPRGDELGEDVFAELASDPGAYEFASDLVGRVEAARGELDDLISDASARWRLDRMDRVDRNILRIATAELVGGQDVPRNVVLAEAVRLAGRYGSDRSARFVNGVVDTLATRIRPDEPPKEGRRS
jgi:transcription antitermination protein NusB